MPGPVAVRDRRCTGAAVLCSRTIDRVLPPCHPGRRNTPCHCRRRGGELQVVRDEQTSRSRVHDAARRGSPSPRPGWSHRAPSWVRRQAGARSAEQRRGDHDPLQEAAGELMWMLARTAAARPRCRLRPAPQRPRLRGRARHVGAGAAPSVMKSPIRRTGSTWARAPWKIIADPLAVGPERRPPSASTSRSLKRNEPVVYTVPGGSSRATAAGGHRLARTGLTDQPHGLTSTDVERDVVQHPALPARDRQIDSEPIGSKQRAHRTALFAWSASRSPSRLTATTTSTMHKPAASDSTG